jgi:DNA polymerase III delta prime subunit
MHAFLLVGQEISNLKNQISNLAKKLDAKVMEFPLVKIDDTRSLNNLIRLSFDKPTLIVCQNIHEAGEEALNAFLKNLEEPQKNIYFALTAPSTRKVLPTIVSRCQVIRTMVTLRDNNSQLTINNEDAGKFIKLSVGEKLAYIYKIKDRDKAIEFTESLVNFYHNVIHSNLRQEVGPLDRAARNAETAGRTLSHLKSNGNLNLQLTNLIISLV